MADLISNDDLAARLQRPVVTAYADSARRWAAGMLRSATGLTTWPIPIPDDLFAWALDLAALRYASPDLVEERTVGGTTDRWGSLRLIVEGILEDAHKAYGGAGLPRGDFPDLVTWPDPPSVVVGATPAAYLDTWTVE